jgi:hypothetical protein
MVEMSRRERRMKVSSEGGLGPERAVVPQMDDLKLRKFPNSSYEICWITSKHHKTK